MSPDHQVNAHLRHETGGADHGQAAVVELLRAHLLELCLVLRADAKRVKPATAIGDERRCATMQQEPDQAADETGPKMELAT